MEINWIFVIGAIASAFNCAMSVHTKDYREALAWLSATAFALSSVVR